MWQIDPSRRTQKIRHIKICQRNDVLVCKSLKTVYIGGLD